MCKYCTYIVQILYNLVLQPRVDFQSRRGSALDLGDGGEGEASERFNLGDGVEDEGPKIAISAPRVSVHRDPSPPRLEDCVQYIT